MNRLTKLAVYSLRVRDVAERQNERLDAFGDAEADLFDFIRDSLSEIKDCLLYTSINNYVNRYVIENKQNAAHFRSLFV